MNERDRLFLKHILDAIADIETFTAEGRAGFMADRKNLPALKAHARRLFEGMQGSADSH